MEVAAVEYLQLAEPRQRRTVLATRTTRDARTVAAFDGPHRANLDAQCSLFADEFGRSQPDTLSHGASKIACTLPHRAPGNELRVSGG